MEGQESKRYKYDGLEFYAVDGHIRLIDTREIPGVNGHEQDIDPNIFEQRCDALTAAIPKCTFRWEVQGLVRMGNDIKACCKEAREQGADSDKKAVAYKVRHKTYQKQMVQVPGGVVRPSGLIVATKG